MPVQNSSPEKKEDGRGEREFHHDAFAFELPKANWIHRPESNGEVTGWSEETETMAMHSKFTKWMFEWIKFPSVHFACTLVYNGLIDCIILIFKFCHVSFFVYSSNWWPYHFPTFFFSIFHLIMPLPAMLLLLVTPISCSMAISLSVCDVCVWVGSKFFRFVSTHIHQYTDTPNSNRRLGYFWPKK